MNDPTIYLVDANHIAYLVKAQEIDTDGILRGFLKSRTNPVDLGQRLWDENAKSVSEAVGKRFSAPAFGDLYLQAEFDFDPLQVYKSCACLEYQSSDSPSWENSLPYQYLELLKRIAVGKLPDFEGLIWGAPKPKNNACQAGSNAVG
jgi:hypothetical protein